MSEMLTPAKPAPLTKDEILPVVIERYLNGDSIVELAKQYGREWRTLYNWMLSYNGEQHRERVRTALTYRIADADLDLETACDKIQVARARERCRFARMDYERRYPQEYGQQQVTSQTINIIVDRSCGMQPIDISAKSVNGSE